MKICQFKETLLPVIDYYRIMAGREFWFDVAPSALLTCFFFYYSNLESEILPSVTSSIINFNAIMAGFNVAAISIFVTGNNSVIQDLKNEKSKTKKIGERKLSLYRITFINLIYSLFVQFLTVFLGVCYNLLYFNDMNNALFFIICLLFLHSIFLNFRNISNLYFSVKEKKTVTDLTKED